jgi:secretion/DNA translocation related TadE-like protein
VAAAVGAAETAATQVRHRAAAAADAAALAAAAEGGREPDSACGAARTAAARADASLVSCVTAGPIVTVTVRADPPAALAWAGPATARARAGPTGLPRPAAASTALSSAVGDKADKHP